VERRVGDREVAPTGTANRFAKWAVLIETSGDHRWWVLVARPVRPHDVVRKSLDDFVVGGLSGSRHSSTACSRCLRWIMARRHHNASAAPSFFTQYATSASAAAGHFVHLTPAPRVRRHLVVDKSTRYDRRVPRRRPTASTPISSSQAITPWSPGAGVAIHSGGRPSPAAKSAVPKVNGVSNRRWSSSSSRFQQSLQRFAVFNVRVASIHSSTRSWSDWFTGRDDMGQQRASDAALTAASRTSRWFKWPPSRPRRGSTRGSIRGLGPQMTRGDARAPWTFPRASHPSCGHHDLGRGLVVRTRSRRRRLRTDWVRPSSRSREVARCTDR